MAPHYCSCDDVVLFILEVIVILTDDNIINITLEGKQSAKAEKLVNIMYDDNEFLYEIAHHFQDEQRYTIALLHDILNKISIEQLATMGFREHYLNSLAILHRSNDDLDSYVDKLIDNKDTTAMDIALVLLEKDNVDTTRLEESRNNL